VVPSIDLGGIWTPNGFCKINPFGGPFFNSVVLVRRAVSVTVSHYKFISSRNALILFFSSVLFGFLFVVVQYYEFFGTFFTFRDCVYGSLFFITTGFHGLHVFLGLVFLGSRIYRMWKKHFSLSHCIEQHLSAIYWHFVDWIWFFVYGGLYLWFFKDLL
jgi:heme/copper-type cytochrome/quinol oxidase subunit 3